MGKSVNTEYSYKQGGGNNYRIGSSRTRVACGNVGFRMVWGSCDNACIGDPRWTSGDARWNHIVGGVVLIASAIPRFGFWEIFKRVLENLKEQGKTNEEILREIDGYPIANELKQKLRDYIENMEGERTDEWQEARLSDLSERVQEILSIVEPLVGKDFEQLGSRLSEKIDDIKKDLNEKIDDVKKDLNDKTDFEQLGSHLNEKIDDVKKDLNGRMDRSETRLKWFISIAVAVGSIATSGIVILIVSLLN